MKTSSRRTDRLKGELEAVTLAKVKAEQREADLIREKRIVDGNNLKSLVECSSLITECDSLTAVVKKFELKVAELQQRLLE